MKATLNGMDNFTIPANGKHVREPATASGETTNGYALGALSSFIFRISGGGSAHSGPSKHPRTRLGPELG
jgi:hypothetical protein